MALTQITFNNPTFYIGGGEPRPTSTIAEMLCNVLERPRPGGITLEQMDRYLEPLRHLRAHAKDLTITVSVETYEMLCEELRTFPFLRVDDDVRSACREFLAHAQRIHDSPTH